MKLYTKTLLLIIILIISQALFTAGLVIRITSGNNTQAAKLELQRESEIIFNNFNSWKRHLWNQLIRINVFMEGRNPEAVGAEDISNLLLSTNVDGVIVKYGGDSFNIQTISTSEDFILPESEVLVVFQDHPYIGMYSIDDALYLAGVISLDSPGGTFNVFLIKHINESFLNNIVFDTRGRIIFHTEKKVLTGNFHEKRIIFDHELELGGNSYFEYYSLEQAGTSWNLAARKCGTLGNPEGSGKVYLTTLLSNEPYKKRIRDIEGSFLNVSLLIILITSLLSLQISRKITRPINRLLMAMEKIREGSFDVQVSGETQDEVGRLLNGFNDMAIHLQEDQLKIKDSMKEILFLKNYNEQIFNSIRDSIAVIDEETRIEKANNFFTARFLKSEDVFPRRLEDLNSTTFDKNIIENITGVLKGNLDFWNQRIRDKGSGVWELKVYPLVSEMEGESGGRRCVLLLEDISQKVEYEEKIFQAEKLASLSMLSAGIAHEVNNPLSSILSNIQNLIYDEPEPEKKELMVLIETETRRIADIIRDLMDLTSREQEAQPISDPAAIAVEVSKLLKHSQSKKEGHLPDIVVRPDKELPMTAISRGELMQLYINLIQNGLYATNFEGPVTLGLDHDKENRMVEITVADRGKGIDSADIPRVFDPFYTTKPTGEGTGLGLSVVYGIIKKYDGRIKITSIKGEGTEVKFRLHEAPVEGQS